MFTLVYEPESEHFDVHEHFDAHEDNEDDLELIENICGIGEVVSAMMPPLEPHESPLRVSAFSECSVHFEVFCTVGASNALNTGFLKCLVLPGSLPPINVA